MPNEEIVASANEGSEAAAEAAVSEFFEGREDAAHEEAGPAEGITDANKRLQASEFRQQKDEIAETEAADENNPDGIQPDATKEEVPKETDTPAEKDELALLQEAEKEAASRGDYEEAMKIRDQAKQLQAAVPATAESFDPNLLQIAKELGGWSDKDAQDLIKANPTLARVTFARIADSYNALSLQYAQGVRQPQAAQQSVPQAGATAGKLPALDDLFADPRRLAEFAEIHGQDLVDKVLKPLHSELVATREDRQYVASLRREALVREVNDTFKSFDSFKDFYGESPVALTKDQNDNRHKVGNLADQIRYGAEQSNVQMTPREALTRAHMIVTHDQHRAQARKAITQEVKRRSTQITSRPSQRNAPAPAAKTEQAALQAVAEFWSNRD